MAFPYDTIDVDGISNAVTTNKRKEVLTEALGRTVGWWSLLINSPK